MDLKYQNKVRVDYWESKLKRGVDQNNGFKELNFGLPKIHALSDSETAQFNSITRGESLAKLTIILAGLTLLLNKSLGYIQVIISFNSIDNTTGKKMPVFCVIDLSGINTVRDLILFISKEIKQSVKYADLELDVLKDSLFSKGIDLVSVAQGSIQYKGLTKGSTHSSNLQIECCDNDRTMEFSINDNISGKSFNLSRVSERFVNVIGQIVKNVNQKPGEVSITLDDELHEINRFCTGKHTAINSPSIIDLFETAVVQNPFATALIYKDKTLTYKELDKRSSLFAGYLQQNHKTGEGEYFGLYLSRSENLIIAMLGILKSGSAYVPLEGYPEKRLQYIIEDINIMTIITSSENQGDLNLNCKLILMDDQSIFEKKKGFQTIDILPEDSCYVIYTSGSTGVPKGVVNIHQGVVNLLIWMQQKYDLTSGSRVMHKSPLTFDASVWEIFWPLTSGAQLFVAEPGGHKDGNYLVKTYTKEKITVTHFVPSLLQVLLSETVMSICNSLEIVFSGGEKLAFSLLKDFEQALPDCLLVNFYGPTETTVSVTYWECSSANNTIYIGEPIYNTQIHILDENLNPTPVGVPGCLHICGSNVARGYINKPELTSANYYLLINGEIAYNTGDKARWSENGQVQFLGRIDNQVKVRGFRIELEEIEKVLLELPDIKEAVVLYDSFHSNKKQLVSFIRLSGELNKEKVIKYLKSKLPDYMIPFILVKVNAFKLNINGKIDVAHLRNKNLNELVSAKNQLGRNEFENELIEAWKVFLQVDDIGITDNYFELGGDSILAIQITSWMSRKGYKIQPYKILNHPTILELSDNLVSNEIETEQGILDGQCGLLPVQQAFFELNNVNPSHYNQSVLLKFDKSITDPNVANAANKIIKKHDALRFKYKHSGGIWSQEYGQLYNPFIIEDISDNSKNSQTIRIEQICDKFQKSLDISKGQLFKLVLIRTNRSEPYNRLFMVIHHLAVDGVSWRIIMDDLLQFLLNDTLVYDDKKSSSFRQWHDKLYAYANDSKIEEHTIYWTNVIKHNYPLPQDFYASNRTCDSIAKVRSGLSADQTNKLQSTVNKVYNTKTKDILLYSLTKTLLHWTQKDKVVIGIEGHGRENLSSDINLSQTVGWFTSIYPVALSINPNSSVAQNIKLLKEQLRTVPVNGLSFGAIKYLNNSQKVRSMLGGEDAFEILFNYLGQIQGNHFYQNIFDSADENMGQTMSGENQHKAKIEVNCAIIDGQLDFTWKYSRNEYKEESILTLANKCVEALVAVLDYSNAQSKVEKTPSDFGLAGLIENDELESLLNK